jgi:hypothetical protein
MAKRKLLGRENVNRAMAQDIGRRAKRATREPRILSVTPNLKSVPRGKQIDRRARVDLGQSMKTPILCLPARQRRPEGANVIGFLSTNELGQTVGIHP